MTIIHFKGEINISVAEVSGMGNVHGIGLMVSGRHFGNYIGSKFKRLSDVSGLHMHYCHYFT